MRKVAFIVTILVSLQSQAQETLPITLEKVLELGGANNLTIQEYKARQELALADLAKAKEWWLPTVYGGAQTHQQGGAVMNGNGRFFLDVSRNNLWLGLGINGNWDFAEGIYKTKAAKLQGQVSGYYSQVERNKVLLQSVNAYYNLMSAQLNLMAYRNLAAQSDTIVRQIQIQVDAGLRYQSEVLLAKSNKNHLRVEMLNAQMEYNLASAELLELLNLDQGLKLVSVDSTLLPLDYSETLASDEGSSYLDRPEMKANELEVQIAEMQKKAYKTGLLAPSLNIGTNTSFFGRLNGVVTPMDPVTFPGTNQLYPTTQLNASLMWGIPLGAFVHGGDNRKYNSLIQLKQIEAKQFESQINKEIAGSLIRLQTGKEQIEIAKEALELTTEALDQSIKRQQLGTAQPFEVFQAQQFYLQAQIDYLRAISEYNKAQFALKVAKGEDL